MRRIAERTLLVGHAGDLRDVRAVMNAGVEAIVELADNEQLAVLPRELIRLRFPLADGADNPPWLLRLAAESVASLLRAGVPVLVCCSAGVNRSLCVAAAGLALAEGRPLLQALAIVTASGPADVMPGFLVQLQRALGE